MSGANRIRWQSAARCHVGLVRETNEDACLDRPARGLWAVADGMGGHDAGDVASASVVAALDALAPCDSLTDRVADARAQLLGVNRTLRGEAIRRDVPIIGSTVVALMTGDNYGAYLWAGDSRLYLYRGRRLKLLTRDHSQIEELKARGEYSAEQAAAAQNLITRAVGAVDTLELDSGGVPVADGDIFLLCTDGLTNHVGDDEIGAALASSDCRLAADTLIDLALKGGGRDNISVVVVRADDPYSSDLTVLNPAL
ncbi:PP2C family protein-serine/threonine phosphatase [Aromatoleum sp.]|uniref:PP2C family protein-serine/threonine phosphatase n=1 Tax=Aromatoleum sp. TaxID=2307007 RepID=UPI002FC7FFCA